MMHIRDPTRTRWWACPTRPAHFLWMRRSPPANTTTAADGRDTQNRSVCDTPASKRDARPSANNSVQNPIPPIKIPTSRQRAAFWNTATPVCPSHQNSRFSSGCKISPPLQQGGKTPHRLVRTFARVATGGDWRPRSQGRVGSATWPNVGEGWRLAGPVAVGGRP